MRYLTLAQSLREEITSGARGPGGLVDSEAKLAARHGVSRDTVRRALEQLRREGLLLSRQGFGWYVAADPIRQTLATLSTIEATLAEQGIEPGRRVLEFGTVEARGPARVLGRRVLRVKRLNLADGEPFAIVTVWCRPRFSRDEVEASTFYELLQRRGCDLGKANQTITAELAGEVDGRLLAVLPGSPLLVCRRTTYDVSGQPVLVSEHRYPAHRTEFHVEIPRADPADGFAPAGLRLRGVPSSPDASVKGHAHA